MSEQGKMILENNVLGALSTVNADGSPWATPLHVFYGEGALHWFSSDRAQHSQNLARDPRVSIVVWSPDESHGPQGVFVSGTARVLDEADRARAAELVISRLGSLPQVFEDATGYVLPLGNPDEARSRGGCYYFAG